MLIGISSVICPELLDALYRMGHGDEIVLADAHFPGESVNSKVIRSDGLRIDKLLAGIMPLFALDEYVEHPISMMDAVLGDSLDPEVEKRYMEAIRSVWPNVSDVERVERFAFYERASNAFAVVMTGETTKYGNIILKKGVTPCCGGVVS